MRVIFLLVFVIIRAAFCGYTTKIINESKGYSGGFWMGALLTELGILIAVFKKELPDAPPNSYRAVPVVKILKKYHYPFVPPQVEPIDILKGNIYAEGEAAKVNLTFYLIHGLFLLSWYGIILSAYLWYIMGYTIYWMFKYKLFKKGTIVDFVNDEGAAANSNSIKENLSGLKERAGSTASKLSQKTEGIKTSAAEKTAIAKEKAGAAFAGIKGKAAEFAAEHKKSDDVDATVADVVDETSTAELIEDSTETESFDELYEKAMSSTDDTEEYDEISDEAAYSAESSASNDSIEELVAAPAISQASATATVPNTAPTAAPQQFNYEEKKSPVVYVMAGIIAVLLVGVGILGGMLLMKNKDDKSEQSTTSASKTQDQTINENAIQSEAENISGAVTEMNVTSDFATENKAAVEEQTEPSAAGNKIHFYPSEKINDYPVYLEKLKDLKNNGTYRYQNNGFFLCDINEDNIPELFATFNTEDKGILFAGSINSGELVPFAESMGVGSLRGITLFDNGTIGITSAGMEGHGVSYTQYSGGNSLNGQSESISYIYENGSLSYISYHNGDQEKHITEAEANEIQKKYVEASYTATPISSVIATTNIPKNTKYIGEGYVNTESTGLNMQSEPNTNSKVIASIPKSTIIACYESGTNGWYITYYKGDAGYVSSEFVSIDSNGSSTVVNGVTVYKCSKSGRINTHGGNLPSITLDYITGGEWQTLRDSLGNGWHIKAIKYCNSKGITWYEIEDADDGDYYGWIDGEYIDFN